jgi:hypothetical protein
MLEAKRGEVEGHGMNRERLGMPCSLNRLTALGFLDHIVGTVRYSLNSERPATMGSTMGSTAAAVLTVRAVVMDSVVMEL